MDAASPEAGLTLAAWFWLLVAMLSCVIGSLYFMRFLSWSALLRLAEIPLAKFSFIGTVVVPAIAGGIIFLRDNVPYQEGRFVSDIEIPSVFLWIYLSTVTYALATVLVQLFAPEVIKRFRLRDEYARFILGQVELMEKYRAVREEEEEEEEEEEVYPQAEDEETRVKEENRRVYQAAVDHVVDTCGTTWEAKDEQSLSWRLVTGSLYIIAMGAGAYVAFIYTPLRVLEASFLRSALEFLRSALERLWSAFPTH